MLGLCSLRNVFIAITRIRHMLTQRQNKLMSNTKTIESAEQIYARRQARQSNGA